MAERLHMSQAARLSDADLRVIRALSKAQGDGGPVREIHVVEAGQVLGFWSYPPLTKRLRDLADLGFVGREKDEHERGRPCRYWMTMLGEDAIR